MRESTSGRGLSWLKGHLPELCVALAIALVWGTIEARENALLHTTIDVASDREVTLLSTSW